MSKSWKKARVSDDKVVSIAAIHFFSHNFYQFANVSDDETRDIAKYYVCIFDCCIRPLRQTATENSRQAVAAVATATEKRIQCLYNFTRVGGWWYVCV